MVQRPTVYANDFRATITETEVIIDFRLKSAKGRPSEEGRVILPHEVASKLGVALFPEEEGVTNEAE